MLIQESAENYLEAIYMLLKEKPQIRSIDVCNKLGFSKPTISVTMKRFRENGYINMDEDGFITLTDKGLEIAQQMFERHVLLGEILISLGVNEETAKDDACKIEHALSQESFDAIKAAYAKMK